MWTWWQSFSIRVKLILFGAGAVAATSLLLVLAGLWYVGQLTEAARQEVDGLIAADLDHITLGVYDLIEAQDEALRQQVAASLRVAASILEREGGLRFAATTTEWQAVNQFSQQSETVALPRALVGGRVLEPNDDPNVVMPVVDEVTRLMGGTATLFQRMNERGDMLRVATTVLTDQGRRAIGTYIPALEPDGTANPVLARVLKGEAYSGVAFVVNAWYLTAYQPLQDASGAVVGMLYVGLPRDGVTSLRRALLDTRVGQTGYVYLLGGQGDDRGHYLLSRRGERDGEDIWETRDADGRFIIQEIVNRAVALGPGELATVRYRWQNAGEAAPRWKVARLAYYAPYDWVIGVGAYEDEFSALQARLSERQRAMTFTYVGLGLMALLLGVLLSTVLARSLARPLTEMAAAADALSAGDIRRDVQHRGSDEVGQLAASFRRMTAYFHEMSAAVDQIAAGRLTTRRLARSERDELGQAFDRMTANLRGLIQQTEAGARTVTAASAQLASAAGQAGQATGQIAAAMQQIAQGIAQQTQAATRTSQAVAQMRQAAGEVAAGSEEQAQAVEKAGVIGAQIQSALAQVAGNADAVAREVNEAARAAQAGAATVAETLQGMTAIRSQVEASAERVREMGRHSAQVGAIVETITDIASQTNLLALNAAIEAARVEAQSGQQVENLLNMYMTAAARLIAQMLTAGKPDGGAEYWDRLAQRSGLEVINVTDADGVVVYSNEAGKVGFRFSDDPKQQSSAFRRLLQETDGVVCQGIQPRSLDKALFKFVGVSRQDQRGLVQVGLRADTARVHRFNVAGFAVVADEVRKLAERAGAAAREIAGLIRGIQKSVAEAVHAMDQGADMVAGRAQQAQAAGDALERILRAVEAVRVQAEAAHQSTQAMSAMAHELTWAMEAVSAVTDANRMATSAMAANAGEVTGSIESIAAVSEENSAAVEEVSAAAEEMSAQVEAVNASAQSLAEMARALQDVVAQFQLEREAAAPASPPPPANGQPPTPERDILRAPQT